MRKPLYAAILIEALAAGALGTLLFALVTQKEKEEADYYADAWELVAEENESALSELEPLSALLDTETYEIALEAQEARCTDPVSTDGIGVFDFSAAKEAVQTNEEAYNSAVEFGDYLSETYDALISIIESEDE